MSRFLIIAAIGGGQPAGTVPPISAPPTNVAPIWSSPTSLSVAENTSGTVYTAIATDVDGDSLTFALGSGGDAAKFVQSGATTFRFASPPSYETPTDADADNVYQLPLTVSDGVNAAVTRTIAITVANVFEVALAGVTVTPVTGLTGAQPAGTLLATVAGRVTGDDLALTGALAAAGAVFNGAKTQILAGSGGIAAGAYAVTVTQSHPDAAATAATSSTVTLAATPGWSTPGYPAEPTRTAINATGV